MRKISPIIATAFLFSIGCATSRPPPPKWNAPIRSTTDAPVPWDSREGRIRLRRGLGSSDFFELASRFQPQCNPLYCGVASSVIILNAFRQERAPSQAELEIAKPEAFGGGRIAFPTYSQATFLNDQTDEVKHRGIIRMEDVNSSNTHDKDAFDPGLTLRQMKAVLETYDIAASLHYADGSPSGSLDAFRRMARNVLSDETTFLLCNFRGNKMGLTTGGHISPVAAHDTLTDSVLVLDVAGHKNSWYWISFQSLFRAMNTKDGNDYRGWLVVSDNGDNREGEP